MEEDTCPAEVGAGTLSKALAYGHPMRHSETSHHWRLDIAERDSTIVCSWQGHPSTSHVRATGDRREQCVGVMQGTPATETSNTCPLPPLLMLLPSWEVLFLPSRAHVQPHSRPRSHPSPRDHTVSSRAPWDSAGSGLSPTRRTPA